MTAPRPPKHRLHEPQTYLDHAARLMLIAAGLICVGLGALGILLPGLPTTPFLLLAAYCFARSSEHFHNWLLNHRWFGSYVRNFESGRGMTRPAKATTLLVMWLSFGFTIVLFVPVVWGQVSMFLLAVTVSVYIMRLPTPAPEATTD
ncbi:MAG TPA: YbaN family protein [Gammaproteobacteria bacterium]|nr:YbaN family protein [Gammaproteobacteria bacterium]